jgi:probable rRNA maturation factor
MSVAAIVNLQRKVRLDMPTIKEFASRLAEKVAEAGGSEFSIAFVSDRRMKELNSFFRDKAATTDVLSFPHEADQFDSSLPDVQPADGGIVAYLGDIVISAEQAERQAKENKLTLDREIRQLMLHGLLHLCGYDHETDDGEMNKRELELRRQLKI